MIKISIYKNTSGIYEGFRAEGHAGYKEMGQDIICSAASMLIINTINSIEEFTEDNFSVDTDEKIGLIEFKLTGESSKESQLLLKTLFFGLKEIKKQYGKKYVTLWNE